MGTRQKHPVKKNATPILTASDPWDIGDQFRFPGSSIVNTIIEDNLCIGGTDQKWLRYVCIDGRHAVTIDFLIDRKIIRIGNLNK